MPEQNLKNILDELIKVLNPRVREVIEKRFGLRSVSCQTLEAIGQNLGVTRERVRQIEALGLRQLANKNVLEPLKPAFETIEKHLMDYGGVRREDYFLRELSQLLSLKEKNNENLIDFILALKQGRFIFIHFKETPKWRAAWALSNGAYNNIISLGDDLRKKLAEQKGIAENGYKLLVLQIGNEEKFGVDTDIAWYNIKNPGDLEKPLGA